MVMLACVGRRMDRQRGLVLIVTLLLLLVMGVLATLAAETAMLQLRMAGNEQARAEVMQHALSVIDAALSDPDAGVVRGGQGYRICGQRSAASCDEFSLELPPGLDGDCESVDFYLTRVGPVAAGMPRRTEHNVSSIAAFDVVRQELTVSCVSQDGRQARVKLVQGLMFGVPAAEQSGVFTTGAMR